MADDDATYPAHREADIALRDGSTVHVRPIRRSDESALVMFFRALSRTSRALRFASATTDYFLTAEARRETDVDYVRTYGLVATTGPEDRIVGHALYAATDRDRAEIAFAILDELQGRGLGTILLGHVAEVAAANGINVLEATVLPENHRMLEVFRASGFSLEVHAEAGQIRVILPASLTPAARERFEYRERIASVNAMKAFFEPRSVAVVGASRRRGTIGGEIFHNLLTYNFAGPVYPVNPGAAVVQCVPAYPSVEAIPGPVDLAVIAVPAVQVIQVAEECGRKGVRAVVAISAGFAELGEEGRSRQRALTRVCRAAGIRLIGPNCMGIINTDPTVGLNATFAPQVPAAGRIGFLSQSGGLGLAILDYARSLGLDLSTFVSVGNKADISGNDLLTYWESDPRTHVILLYLESFGNPRKFSRIARRVGGTKPIVTVKSGRSQAGARATSSHTGALLAASDLTVDALFHQAGVIRTDTLEEMFDIASLLVHQPTPRGRRVAIITNAGGPGILCADACEAEGLVVSPMSEPSQARLRTLLPPEASLANPIDMIASATAEQYRETIRVAGADPHVDALIVIFVPPLVTRPEDVGQAIVDAARDLRQRMPVLTVFMSTRGVPDILKTSELRIPSYAFPEAAAIALAHVARYGEWRGQPSAETPAFSQLRRDEGAAIVAAALGRGTEWLSPEETHALLACYGLPVAELRVASGPEEAAAAADALAGDVALKAIAPGLVHKTELGAVQLRLRGAEQVQCAAEAMRSALAAKGHVPTGFLVQRMARDGVEMIVGVVHDRQFGPVIACGAGGVRVELLRDVSIRLAPLTAGDASDMIQSLKTYPLLTGFRGSAAADVSALQEALLRVSALVEDLPQIAELDCNPILVHASGATVVDARVRVAPAEPPRPLAARR